MAIEFNCPYCTAPIRVPDAFSGKRGSCPKCSTKLLVPDVAPPQSAVASNAPTQPAESANPMPHPQAEVDALSAAGNPENPDNPASLPNTIASPSQQREVLTPPPDFAAPGNSSSLSRRLKRKQRRKKAQRIYAIGIPVVCFLLFFGVVAVVTFLGKKELNGTLRAAMAPHLDMQQEAVAVATFGLTPDEEAQTFQAFENAPESFTSAQMRCTISLQQSALAIELQPAAEFSFFSVNPSSDPVLMEWIRDNQSAINKTRLKRITETGADLCRDKIKKASGTPLAFDAETYRDGFGLSAHVGAFGFVVEAITSNKRSRCVHEDTNGTLYFILPRTTTEFTLRGRKQGNAKPLFPGEYQVLVESNSTAPGTDATESEVDAAPSEPPEEDADMDADDTPKEMSSEEQSDAGMSEMNK